MVAVEAAGKGQMGNELSLEDQYVQMVNMELYTGEDEGQEGRRDRVGDRRELEEGSQGWKLVGVGVLVDAHVVAEVVALEKALVQGEVLGLPMVQGQGLAVGLEEHELVQDLVPDLAVATMPVREQYPGWPSED